jgi:hypothetical protein
MAFIHRHRRPDSCRRQQSSDWFRDDDRSGRSTHGFGELNEKYRMARIMPSNRCIGAMKVATTSNRKSAWIKEIRRSSKKYGVIQLLRS